MEDFFILQDAFFKLLFVVMALSVAIVTLRKFDKLIGIDFKNSFKKVEENAQAFSIYIGLRFIGIAIIISSII